MRTKGPGKVSRLTVACSAAVLAVVTLGLVVWSPSSVAGGPKTIAFTPSPTPLPLAPALETPRPEPVETPLPAPVAVPHELPNGCPQLNNPGGRVDWIPSDNAGPWPTDGIVSIPTIGTSAPVVRVGVDNESQMVVPPNAGQVAWLDQGGIPGQTNNVVLAGHVTWAGIPGAFHRIGNLLPGDMIVLSIDGRRMVFKTTWVCEFPRTSQLAPRIMGYTDVPSVTLITCAGAWDSGADTHADRVVARAELVY